VGTHYYDTENRMTKALQGSSNNYYFYDANGKRVRRILNGSQTWGGQETWFVYGFEEEMVAEYAYNQVSAPLPGSPQKEYGYRGGKMLVVWDGTQAGDEALKWLVADHLGSTRMEANKSGSLAGMRRHDYLPFGEELVASSGAQRSGVGYEPPASNVKQKFGL
jgi:YD repeat-containing protein